MRNSYVWLSWLMFTTSHCIQCVYGRHWNLQQPLFVLNTSLASWHFYHIGPKLFCNSFIFKRCGISLDFIFFVRHATQEVNIFIFVVKVVLTLFRFVRGLLNIQLFTTFIVTQLKLSFILYWVRGHHRDVGVACAKWAVALGVAMKAHNPESQFAFIVSIVIMYFLITE